MASFRLALVGIIWAIAHGQNMAPSYDEVDSQDQQVNAAERLSVFEASSWAVPARVARCPVHQTASASVNGEGGLEMDTDFVASKMYSILEGPVPQAAINSGLAKYDGIEMAFANSKLQHFKVRLSDDHADVRFIAAVKANSDGEHILWLKWSDFHGEELMQGGIKPCTEEAPCRNISHGSITSIAILIPMEQDEAYVASKFTIHNLTLDVLASGSGTGSTEVRPPSEAEEINFGDPDVTAAISSAQSQGAFMAPLFILSLANLL